MASDQAHRIGTRKSAKLLPPCVGCVQVGPTAAAAGCSPGAALPRRAAALQSELAAGHRQAGDGGAAQHGHAIGACMCTRMWPCTRSNPLSSARFGVPPLCAIGWYGYG